MNGYIRNLKGRLQGRELVTQSNFFNRKTPDLDGVQTQTKFGFSTRKNNNNNININNNAGSPGINRRVTPTQNLLKRQSDIKMSTNYQKFQSGNYYYVRNNR